MDKKQQIIAAMYAFIAQRAGLEFGNYGDVKSYRAEQRAITKDRHDARRLIRDVELRDSISADDILTASRGAYSGRLTLIQHDDGKVSVDYCTGQYFPTEYRKAVCAVMASVLWAWKRDQCMPTPKYRVIFADGTKTYAMEKTEAEMYAAHRSGDAGRAYLSEDYNGLSGGDYMRAGFKREYGRGMAARWFS